MEIAHAAATRCLRESDEPGRVLEADPARTASLLAAIKGGRLDRLPGC